MAAIEASNTAMAALDAKCSELSPVKNSSTGTYLSHGAGTYWVKSMRWTGSYESCTSYIRTKTNGGGEFACGSAQSNTVHKFITNPETRNDKSWSNTDYTPRTISCFKIK